MATTLYASLADLSAYLGGAEPPATATRLLLRAQDLIDTALISSLFAIDDPTTGNPTDAGVLAALKKATCAQVEFWITNGDELDELGQWQSFSIEGISATRRADDSRRRERLCDRARDALRAPQVSGAPLLPGWVAVP